MKPLTVMVTGVGGPGIAGTIYSLRNNPDNRPITIIGVDADADAVGRHLVDSFAVVLRASDPDFINDITDLAWLYEVDVILPHNTAELPKLAARISWFAERNIAIAISPVVTMNIANNKFKTMHAAKRLDIPVPETIAINNIAELVKATETLGYPDRAVIVKPPISHGGRGFRILAREHLTSEQYLSQKFPGTAMSLGTFCDMLNFRDWPELMVCEYLPGKEYSVDIFRSKDKMVVVPRIREKVRDGTAFKTRIDLRDDLIRQSFNLAHTLGLEYAFGFQFKENSEGILALIECNPRIQGTMIASTLAGTNIIYAAAAAAVGFQIKLSEARDGAIFERYWGGISEGNPIEYGVIY